MFNFFIFDMYIYNIGLIEIRVGKILISILSIDTLIAYLYKVKIEDDLKHSNILICILNHLPWNIIKLCLILF